MFKTLAISVLTACLSALTPALAATPEAVEQNPSAWRAVNPEDLIWMSTTKGDIFIEIAPDVSPAHAAQIRLILREHLYDGTVFHRVINGFMAQGGDISKIRGADPGLPSLKGEFTFRRDPAATPIRALEDSEEPNGVYAGFHNGFPFFSKSIAQADYSTDRRVESWMPHCAGVTSMARTNDPDSAVDQFFLMRDEGDFLNRNYTPWGRIIKGLDIVRALNVGEPPAQPDVLVKARLASDIPAGERPRAWVAADDSAMMKTLVSDNAGKNICDVGSVPAMVDIP